MIETNRCILEVIKDVDYEKVQAIYMNEEVRKFLGGIVSREEFNIKFSEMLVSDKASFYWDVRLKNSNDFIGLVSLDKHHDGFSTEVSYQFMPQYWGKGYGEEVIRAIIYYAFKELGIDEVVAETQGVNKGSCKLLAKVGMKLTEKISRFGAEQYIFSISKL